MDILIMANNAILPWDIVTIRDRIVTISQTKIALSAIMSMFILDSDSLFWNKYEIYFKICVPSQKYIYWKKYENSNGI